MAKKAVPKKKPVRRKKKPAPKPRFQLKQWQLTMATILATAAVIGLGWRFVGSCVSKAKEIDNRWVHSSEFEKTTDGLVTVDTKLEEDIKLVGKRLDQKIKQDQIDWRWRQQQELLTQFGSFEKMPQWARDKYLRLQKEIDDIKSGKKMAF